MGTIEKMFIALGTVNQITAWFDEPERETARIAVDKAEEYVNGMDDRLSVFKPDSEISMVNSNAGIRDTLLSGDTFDLLELSVKYGELTGGLFDITTKPLTEAGRPDARINYHDILLDKRSLSVRLRNAGQGIHLGGIAKGYAIDRVSEILKRYGVKKAMINLGGTVRNIGESGTVGVRNPFEPKKTAVFLESVDEAVVTSGLYERGNHIFNPVSGKPAVSDLVSATVVGDNGAAADVAATVCMITGSVRGARLLDFLGLEGVFILRDGGIFATNTIRKRVKSA